MCIKRYFRPFSFFIVTMVALLESCTGNEKKQQVPSETGDIYFDYRIWGDEERDLVTITLQYRQGDASGDPIMLVYPQKAELDGDRFPADSSVMNGVYYELSRAVSDFEGNHELIFTDTKGKTYTEDFHFSAMRLKGNLPAEMERGKLEFELAGIDTSALIHVVMTDTSFYSRGIDRVDTVRNGKVVISEADLENLQSGPVYLEFYREEIRPLKKNPGGGGNISISYSLKRSFTLYDRANRM